MKISMNYTNEEAPCKPVLPYLFVFSRYFIYFLDFSNLWTMMNRRTQVQRAPKLEHEEHRHAVQYLLAEIPSSVASQASQEGHTAWVWWASRGALSLTNKRRKSFFINGASQHCWGRDWQATEWAVLQVTWAHKRSRLLRVSRKMSPITP